MTTTMSLRAWKLFLLIAHVVAETQEPGGSGRTNCFAGLTNFPKDSGVDIVGTPGEQRPELQHVRRSILERCRGRDCVSQEPLWFLGMRTFSVFCRTVTLNKSLGH